MELTNPFDARGYVDSVKRALDAIADQTEAVVDVLFRAWADDRTMFIVGNGGSAANACHFAQDLSKGTIADPFAPKRCRAISLAANSSLVTAVANDLGYESTFLQPLITFARRGDVLVALSGSGNSANVLRAVEYANAHEMFVVAFTGFRGGRLGELARLQLNVPSDDIGIVEGVHGVAFHMISRSLAVRLEAAVSISTEV